MLSAIIRLGRIESMKFMGFLLAGLMVLSGASALATPPEPPLLIDG